MRQAAAVIEKALRNGLRRFSNNPRNAPGLVECFNLAPAEQGLEPHETITSPGDIDISWNGSGQYTATTATRTLVVRVRDYLDLDDLSGISVYLDDVLKGTTDSNGELSLSSITTGGYRLKLVGYPNIDSDLDTLYNEHIMVI